MKIQPAVREKTIALAIGVLLLTVLMVGVFLVIGQFDWTVLTGALLGAAIGIANFFLMALTVQRAADEMDHYPLPQPEPSAEGDDSPEAANEKDPPLSEGARRGRNRIRVSYALRMLGVAALAALGVILPCFHSFAVLIPLLFPGLVIRIIGLRNKEGG